MMPAIIVTMYFFIQATEFSQATGTDFSFKKTQNPKNPQLKLSCTHSNLPKVFDGKSVLAVSVLCSSLPFPFALPHPNPSLTIMSSGKWLQRVLSVVTHQAGQIHHTSFPASWSLLLSKRKNRRGEVTGDQQGENSFTNLPDVFPFPFPPPRKQQ